MEPHEELHEQFLVESVRQDLEPNRVKDDREGEKRRRRRDDRDGMMTAFLGL